MSTFPPRPENTDWSKQHLIKKGTKGKPYYFRKLPFTSRYPRITVFGGTALSMIVLFGPWIYKNVDANLRPERYSPVDFMWKSERDTGVTKLEYVREHVRKRDERWAKRAEEKRQEKEHQEKIRAQNKEAGLDKPWWKLF